MPPVDDLGWGVMMTVHINLKETTVLVFESETDA